MTRLNDEIHKVCTSCKKNLPLSAYGNHARGKYGKRSQCRACRNDYVREHRGTGLQLCATNGCNNRITGFGYCGHCLTECKTNIEVSPVLARYGFRLAEVRSEVERVEGLL